MIGRITRYHSLGYSAAEHRSVTPMPQWVKDLVPKPIGKNETVVSSHEDVLRDTLPLIKNKIYRTLSHTKKLAAKLKGNSLEATTRNDWNLIFDHIKYVKDMPGDEEVRSPRRLIHEGRGDCDCFTVTLSSLLLNQGIPHFLRIMKETEDWSHIYIVVPKNGKLSKLTNRDQYIVMDCVTDSYDYEPPHTETKDFPMALKYLDGLGAEPCPTKPVSERIIQYVDTDQIIRKGLIPTKQFLAEKNISAIAQKDGSFLLSTPNALSEVPSVITPMQAEAIVKATSAPAESIVVAESMPEEELKELQAGGPNHLLWYLLIGGMALTLVFGEDKQKEKEKLNGPKKRKLKSLRI